MPRIVSVWLEHWPVTRLRRAQSGARQCTREEATPLVVAAADSGGLRLTAVDARARALGLRPGEPLARARARIGTGIAVHPADPEADAAALRRLCLWARRYTPIVAPFRAAEGADGFFLDIAGASHLLGGEAALMRDLAGRLSANALPARLALADTPGAAFALACHGRQRENPIVMRGATAEALRGLPVAALRLDPAIVRALGRLGLRRIGALEAAHRAPLARRFGQEPLLRLDQALGYRPEPLILLGEALEFGAMRGFLDPIGRQDTIVATAMQLMREIASRLEAAGLGARGLRLTLQRVDGIARTVDLGLSEPTRCEARVGRLLDLRLDRIGSALDAGFGFELVRLDVTGTGPMPPRQIVMKAAGPAAETREAGTGWLADALHQRLGRRVIRLEPRKSHIPERADTAAPCRARPIIVRWPAGAAKRSDDPAACPPLPPRPLILLRQGEAAEDVLSLAPDGPPQRFRWRRRLHRIAHAEGPERIAAEWWRETAPIRDYYVVENEAGSRLWVYREGFHTPRATPRWFVHGLFA